MHPHNLFKTTCIIAVITLYIGTKCFSQKQGGVTFGKVSASDFILPVSSIIDSNANAVIIAKTGSLEFVGNKHTWISYSYKQNIRIKILNSKAYELATKKIRLYGDENEADALDNLSASTYNLLNGKVIETKMPKSDIFTEKITKGITEEKFTMPDVKEGSIIEYSYTIISYRFYNLPEWKFQSLEYPCLYSEYKLAVPDLVRYSIVHYGADSFYSSKTDETYTALTVSGNSNLLVRTNVHNHTWVMKDIPAFKEEDYINQPSDYLDKLEFVLTQTYGGADVHNINTGWKNAEDGLLRSGNFGAPIKTDRLENMSNLIDKICPAGRDVLSDAKSIYIYVRDNFTCTPDNEIYIDRPLYDINKSRRGSVADLNMLVIALLRLKELHADPVILSTRDYGTHPANYPVLDKMNYVICMLRIGKDTMYLDASDPLLGFGHLPISCYNGHAQVIDENHSGAVYFLPGDIKEQKTTSVTITNNEDGNVRTASFESTLGYFESYDLRDRIKGHGLAKYTSEIKTSYGPDYEITNLAIDSLTNLDCPVKITYDINFKTGNDEDIIYFNPFIVKSYKDNPFKSATRKYTLEMPYPIDDTYELSMDIPKGYKVDELPKAANVSFNATDGFFKYTISKDQYLVQMKAQIKIVPAIFAAEDYTPLRDFFSYIVKKESEQIVYKKN